MSDAFELLPKHDHSPNWKPDINTAPHITCPGKDPDDTKCTCPDLVYATRIRLRTGHTFMTRFYCGCCDLPLADPSV